MDRLTAGRNSSKTTWDDNLAPLSDSADVQEASMSARGAFIAERGRRSPVN